jgi:hypothetical protein
MIGEIMSYTYKNTSDREQVLIHIGVVKAGETVTVDDPINNPNFQRVDQPAPQPEVQQPSVVSVEQPQPNAVTEAQPAITTQPQGDQQQ